MASKGSRNTPKFTSFRPQTSIDATEKSHGSARLTKEPLQEHKVAKDTTIEAAAVDSRRTRHDNVTARQVSSQALCSDRGNEHFFLDLKGDPDNQRYGYLYKYSVPQYRRSGFGSVIGLSKWWKINRESERSHGIELLSTQFDSRGPRQVRSLERGPELRIRPSAYSTVPIDHNVDFIALDESKLGKRKRWSETQHSRDSQTSDCASPDSAEVQPGNSTDISAPRRGSFRDGDLEVSSVTAVELSQEYTDKLVADLNKRLRVNPSRGALWLELADTTNRSSSSASSRDIAEARMSILDEGLRKVKDVTSRESLLWAYLKEAEAVMDSERLVQLWEGLIKKNDQSMSLRSRYLRFLQTNPAFRLYDFRDCAFETLSAINQQFLAKHNPSPDDARYHFESLLYTTSCLRDAGFCELANAIWQINLEWNFLMTQPKEGEQVQSVQRANSVMLENFWESEDRRIGEPLGDDHVESTHRENEPAKMHGASYLNLRAWSLAENISSGAHFSARITEDNDPEDPFSVVMFSDIKDCVIATTGKADEQHFLNAFLAYFQLPAYVPERPLDNDRMSGTLLPSNAGSLLPTDEIGIEPHLLHAVVNAFQLDETLLFANSRSWISAFSHKHFDHEQHRFGRLALQRLVEVGAGSEALAEYYLGWELFEEPLDARKTAKKLLKRYPGSIRLYNAYALIEARCGRELVAEGVLQTVLASNASHKDSILLQRTWLWLLIEAGEYDKALAKLIEFGDSPAREDTAPDTSAIAVLKARKAISLQVESHISLHNYEEATRHMEIGVLLEYLSSPAPLPSALDTFKTFVSRLSTLDHKSRAEELLHQFRARLIYSHHILGRDFNLIKPRELLLESIRQYPYNAIFILLLEALDPWVGVNDRLHTILSGIRDSSASPVPKQQDARECITPHLYAVRSEVRRYSAGKSTVHAVRHAFESAVSSNSCAHCPLLWRWYCEFESHAGDLKQMRQCFYRAMRACPWAKDIYLMAFDELRSAMSIEDLKGVYELMEEKELRIRVALDQTLVEAESTPRKQIPAST